jgi:hypothetical protein
MILTKYRKIMSIRVKDVIFKQWLQKLKNEQIILGHYSNPSTLLNDSKMNIVDKDFGYSEYDIGTDHSSIVSSHYIKSKSIYQLKKIFNRNCLKTYFDMFVIKLF